MQHFRIQNLCMKLFIFTTNKEEAASAPEKYHQRQMKRKKFYHQNVMMLQLLLVVTASKFAHLIYVDFTVKMFTDSSLRTHFTWTYSPVSSTPPIPYIHNDLRL